MPGWNHDNAHWQPKQCLVCEEWFIPRSGAHKFCCSQHKGKWKYITGEGSTENQYKYISGNWLRYFGRLCNKKTRPDLTAKQLVDLLEEQDGKCALSGVELTCLLEKGNPCPTNASIDRIVPGGPYTMDNIQLVCKVLNLWRGDTDLVDFINWCRRVSKFHEEEE